MFSPVRYLVPSALLWHRTSCFQCHSMILVSRARVEFLSKKRISPAREKKGKAELGFGVYMIEIDYIWAENLAFNW